MVQKFPLLEVVQACHSLLIPTRTQHVVAVQTVTKAEFRSSQTHEFEGVQGNAENYPCHSNKRLFNCTSYMDLDVL